MKKSYLFALFLVLNLPFIVNAKEYCKVVSGDGKSLGSEIACGSEHFYVLSSDNNSIRMLAKYNLYTGVSIYKEKIEKAEGDTRSDSQYCSDLATSKGGKVKSDSFYNVPGYCFYTKSIDNDYPAYTKSKPENDNRDMQQFCKDSIQEIGTIPSKIIGYTIRESTCKYYAIDRKILQSEDAKSAHWDGDLNYLYPQIGDVYISPITSSQGDHNYEPNDYPIQENSDFYDYTINDTVQSNVTLSHSLIENLKLYNIELSEMGYEINDITLLPLSELDSITKKISNKSLPLKDWGDNLTIVQGQYSYNDINYGTEVAFGDLKPYIPEKYKWLYSTTYWNSSVYKIGNRPSIAYPEYYYVFTAEQGKLCGAGFAFCAPETTLGCGIRPVITIPNKIQYLIKAETDGNGTIEVIENSLGGENITFKVTAKKDYRLKKIVITTDSGETVEFSEGEIIKNDDGTYSIDKNKFTMPFENITIKASWTNEITNPETSRYHVHLIIIVIGILVVPPIYLKHSKKSLV